MNLEYFLKFIDKNMLEIMIVSGSIIMLLFLARSFRRNMLIEKGQARFVLERYDVATEKMHKWITFIVLFMLLPLFAYVKFLNQ